MSKTELGTYQKKILELLRQKEQKSQQKEWDQEEKFKTKFISIFESIDWKKYMLDYPEEDDLKTLSIKARKMLERLHYYIEYDDKIDLFDLCYERLDLEVVKTILLMEKIETKWINSQLKDSEEVVEYTKIEITPTKVVEEKKNKKTHKKNK